MKRICLSLERLLQMRCTQQLKVWILLVLQALMVSMAILCCVLEHSWSKYLTFLHGIRANLIHLMRLIMEYGFNSGHVVNKTNFWCSWVNQGRDLSRIFLALKWVLSPPNIWVFQSSKAGLCGVTFRTLRIK